MKVFTVFVAVFLGVSGLPMQIELASNTTRSHLDERFSISNSFGSSTRGGQGGATWTVWDPWSLRDAVSGNSARVVIVMGRLDLTHLFTGSPGVVIDVGSWKTIQGGGNAEITGGGFRLKNNQHVIIQDIKFTNAISYAPGEWPNGNGGIVAMVPGEFTEVDAILLETSEYVWINHNEFSDDPWDANSIPNDMMRHDGHLDIKRGSNWITVSYNIFRNHNKNILIGHSDSNAAQDVGKLKTTFFSNWFMGVNQRNPRVRFGEIHILNNLYTDIGDYGIGAGAGALIYAESNVFINTRAWRHPSGTPNPMGFLLNVNNLLINSNFDAVPSDGVTWRPSSYYSYNSMNVDIVDATVRSNAGPRI